MEEKKEISSPKEISSKELGKNIVEKIKKEKIQPHSKRYFQTKNILFWALLVITLCIAGIAAGAIVYYRRTLDNYFFTELIFSHKIKVLLLGFPIFWILLMGAALFFTIKWYRSTKWGYKAPTIILILVNVALLVLLGTSEFLPEFIEKIDRRGMFPRQLHIGPRQEELWMNPEEGLISGTITSVNPPYCTIQQLDQSKWILDLGRVKHFAPEFTLFRKDDDTGPNTLEMFSTGDFIRATGRIIGEKLFSVDKVFPPFRKDKEFNPEAFEYFYKFFRKKMGPEGNRNERMKKAPRERREDYRENPNEDREEFYENSGDKREDYYENLSRKMKDFYEYLKERNGVHDNQIKSDETYYENLRKRMKDFYDYLREKGGDQDDQINSDEDYYENLRERMKDFYEYLKERSDDHDNRNKSGEDYYKNLSERVKDFYEYLNEKMEKGIEQTQ